MYVIQYIEHDGLCPYLNSMSNVVNKNESEREREWKDETANLSLSLSKILVNEKR